MELIYYLIIFQSIVYALIFFRMTSTNREEWRNINYEALGILTGLIGLVLSSAITIILYYGFRIDRGLMIIITGLLLSFLFGLIFSYFNNNKLYKDDKGNKNKNK